MKTSLTILFLGFFIFTQAQSIDYNTTKGFVANGYDVTEYFNQKAIKGNDKFISTHDQVKYRFSSKKNLEKFINNPEKYVPQYGGYCAYAVAVKNEKIGVNPKTFEIRDGKLYLFYNAWGVNTLEKWQKENTEQLQEKADMKWKTIKVKN